MSKKGSIFYNEDFASFQQGPYGIVCPPGNYTNVTKVPDNCMFQFQVVFSPGVDIGKQCRFHAPVTLPPYSTIGKCCAFEDDTHIGKHSVVLPFTCFCGKFTCFDRGCRLNDVRLFSDRTRLSPDIRLVGYFYLKDGDGKIHRIDRNIRESGTFGYVVTDRGEVLYTKSYGVETAKHRLEHVRIGCSTNFIKWVEEETERARLAR